MYYLYEVCFTELYCHVSENLKSVVIFHVTVHEQFVVCSVLVSHTLLPAGLLCLCTCNMMNAVSSMRVILCVFVV